MNIPREQLVEILQDLCHTYESVKSAKYRPQYSAKLETVSLLFSIKADLITANISNIVAEDKREMWGEILFKCLKEHQKDFGVDYD